MQIVIDIPKELYEYAVATGDWVYKNPLINLIANAKILPEKHGRLIDADELLKHFERGHMCWGEDVAFVINQETHTVLEGNNENTDKHGM